MKHGLKVLNHSMVWSYICHVALDQGPNHMV
ncbi:hypothetical protein NC653_025967 [Populus alba x Populus x berolinensis]|uniref:Uncharacterized protein n=1 Tax=Populus alba x Populus x berolinensis TaxID=444605 RepID=A0AAD6MCN7_9ROSI|nr:hypothetical protein NC653_025967 [Populus alba x Populus x berolinensis]